MIDQGLPGSMVLLFVTGFLLGSKLQKIRFTSNLDMHFSICDKWKLVPHKWFCRHYFSGRTGDENREQAIYHEMVGELKQLGGKDE
jgi:hypothetical protein